MSKLTSLAVLAAVVAIVGVALWGSFGNHRFGQETEEIEHTDYKMPDPPPEEFLVDDRLEDKKPPVFDPALVDPRPVVSPRAKSCGSCRGTAFRFARCPLLPTARLWRAGPPISSYRVKAS